jgi:hypothetical protein
MLQMQTRELRIPDNWSAFCRSFAERNNGVINVLQLAPVMKVTSQNYLYIVFYKKELQTMTSQKCHPISIMMYVMCYP